MLIRNSAQWIHGPPKILVKLINRLFLPFIALEHLAEAAASCAPSFNLEGSVHGAGCRKQDVIEGSLDYLKLLPECSLYNHYGHRRVTL